MLLQDTSAGGGFPVGWDLVTVIVAFAALAQPWVVSLFRKIARKGSSQFYESGKLSLFFWTQGLGIELVGTVKANHEDQFLRSMNVVITRGDNVERHVFEWRSFRYPVVDFQGVTKSDFGIASSLMVPTARPEYMDTLFFDPGSEQEVESIGDKVKAAWKAFVEAQVTEWSDEVQESIAIAPEGGAVMPVAVRGAAFAKSGPRRLEDERKLQMFDEFAKKPEIIELKADLDRACFWRHGDYALTLNLVTDQPEATFAHPGSFHLSESEVRALRGHSGHILRAWCEVTSLTKLPTVPPIAYKLNRP